MSVTAQAVVFTPLNPADFAIAEGPGQYTVFNNSASWYIYGFAVSNPALPAALPLVATGAGLFFFCAWQKKEK